MKKRFKLIFFLIGMFFAISNVNALTKITFNEASNGTIATTLHFEEGFVGGIDITFNVSGNVSVKDFKFSDKIASAKYSKGYSYDASKNSLTVHVATGGIGSKHNLLNSKKELSLGSIIFTSSAKADVNYKLAETSFKIVDNNWNSKTIQQSHITLGDKTSFVYKVSKEEPPKEDKPQENPKEDSKDGETSKGDSSKNEESSKKEETTNSSKNKESSKVSSVSKKEESSSKSESSKKEETKDEEEVSETETTKEKEENDDKKEETSNSEKEDEDSSLEEQEGEKKKKKAFDWKFVFKMLVLIAIILGIYFFIVIKRKDEE